jgi:hypothetical protein
LNDVNIELGYSGTTALQMDSAEVRTLAGLGASPAAVDLNSLHGKSGFRLIADSEGPIGGGAYVKVGRFVSVVDSAVHGSTTPSPVAINGNTLVNLNKYTDNSGNPNVTPQLVVRLNGTLAQSAFATITISGSTYYSGVGSASFGTQDGESTWAWFTANAPIVDITDGQTYVVRWT